MLGKIATICLFVGLLVLGFVNLPDSEAAVLEGRITSSYYSWQNTNGPGETVDHLHAYQSISLSWLNTGVTGLSLHAHLADSKDLLTGSERESHTEFTSLYLRWQSRSFLRDLRVGRSFVPLALRPGTIDGVQSTFSLGGMRTLTLYAGAILHPENRFEIADWDREHLVGLSLMNIKLADTNFRFAYWRRTSAPVDPLLLPQTYERMGADDLAEETASLRAARKLGRNTMFSGNLRYDLLYERISRGQAAIRFGLSRDTFVETSCLYRTPTIDYNSIFSLFPHEPTTEIGVALSHYFRAGTSLFAQFSRTFLYEDAAHRLSVRGRVRNVEGALSFRNGYGGEAFSASAAYGFDITRYLSLRTRASYARYSYLEDVNGKNEVLSSSVALSLNIAKGLVLDIEAPAFRQNISTPAPDGYTGDLSDLRLFVQMRYAFGFGRTNGNIAA